MERILKRYRELKTNFPVLEEVEKVLRKLVEYERILDYPEISHLRAFLSDEVHNRVWYYLLSNRPIPEYELNMLRASVLYVENKICSLELRKMSREDKWRKDYGQNAGRESKELSLLETSTNFSRMWRDPRDIEASIVEILKERRYGLKAKQIARKLGFESGSEIVPHLKVLKEEGKVEFDGRRWRLSRRKERS